jgi:hypothetical protein
MRHVSQQERRKYFRNRADLEHRVAIEGTLVALIEGAVGNNSPALGVRARQKKIFRRKRRIRDPSLELPLFIPNADSVPGLVRCTKAPECGSRDPRGLSRQAHKATIFDSLQEAAGKDPPA